LADRVRARLASRLPGRTIETRDARTLLIRSPDGSTHTLSLDNVALACEKSAADCEQAIEHHVGATAEMLSDHGQDEKAENVFAVIKDANYLEELRRNMARSPPRRQAGNQLVPRPFAADLSIVYVFDLPRSTKLINHDALAKLGLDEAGLDALARKNLKDALKTLPHAPIAPGSR